MKISYRWVKEFLPKANQNLDIISTPAKMGEILTAVGLEVEGIHHYEEVIDNLNGLVVGEIISCVKHPDADKLQVTLVNIGEDELQQIVCGAPNVAKGQKVIVALPGSTIYSVSGETLKMKETKIRGEKSSGMICAEDEIGIGANHDGIVVLPDNLEPGSKVADYFYLYEDYVFDIGLTPNRMSAMSHRGVARDICAFLSNQLHTRILLEDSPVRKIASASSETAAIEVKVIDVEACHRYAGISITGLKVEPSPKWMQDKLKAVGVRPINNIVDITNYILQETGQPLHAFDLDKIERQEIHVRFLPQNTPFITLDEKERKLNATDLMICDGNDQPMCIGGVFGGATSGVTPATKSIFLESAWFHPSFIRRTSLAHNLRTDAASHFEKGVDIGKCVEVLQKAAALIVEITGGEIASSIVDIYPFPHHPMEIKTAHAFIEKLSGKKYPFGNIRAILESLEFQVTENNEEYITVRPPLSSPDIQLPADIVEEIMRIDGLDNIPMPQSSVIAFSENQDTEDGFRKKIAGWLTGQGFSEIFTNSITKSSYYGAGNFPVVKILNSINVELDIMRPAMLYSGLESVAYNLNRKNSDLLFFEFGKIYHVSKNGISENKKLALYFTGDVLAHGWNRRATGSSIYYAKGICTAIASLAGLYDGVFNLVENPDFTEYFTLSSSNIPVAKGGKLSAGVLQKFSIRQPVYFVSFDWGKLNQLAYGNKISFSGIPRFPMVKRDLSVLVEKSASFESLEKTINELGVKKLVSFELFDLFESAKIGAGKKSFAINFTFSDPSKTLTDEEIDKMMKKIMAALSAQNNAEIRMQPHETA